MDNFFRLPKPPWTLLRIAANLAFMNGRKSPDWSATLREKRLKMEPFKPLAVGPFKGLQGHTI